MRIPMAVWVLGCLPGCEAGCEPGGSLFSARLVIGVEPQTIAREDLPANATALVLRSQNEVVFPLVPTSPEAATRIVVQSDFRLGDVVQSSTTFYDDEARIGEMGLYIPLRMFAPATYSDSRQLYMYETPELPLTDTWRGSFEVELRGEITTRVKIDVAPVLNPCQFDATAPAEYAPDARIDVAMNSTATCLDGSECLARGTLLDRDAHSIVVAPFVISTRIQAWCESYYGY